MRYFVDTEFDARPGKPIVLISIGVVSEDGREFYCVNTDALTWWSRRRFSPWVKDNVVPLLLPAPSPPPYEPYHRWVQYAPLKRVRSDFYEFIINDNSSPEFWGYMCGYDYVVVSQLMGTMQDWPQGWPYYFRDLRQLVDERGLGSVPKQEGAEHHALADARWIRQAYSAAVSGYS